jgi:adenosylcobinamide-phosphate synthase
MFLLGLNDRPGTVDPLILLLGALVIEFVLGRFSFSLLIPGHPLSIIAASVTWLEKKLNRDSRTNMDRAIRGGFVLVFVVLLCLVIGLFIAWLTGNRNWGWIVEVSLLVTLLGQGHAFHSLQRIGRSLQRGHPDRARKIIIDIAPDEVAVADEHAIARTGISWAGQQYALSVVTPCIWYVLFGFPGIMIYVGTRVTAQIIGQTNERYGAFGFAARQFHDVLYLFPARLSGLFIALAAIFVPTTQPAAALRTMLHEANRHYTMNGGWPLAALAGALELAFGGPRVVDGRRVDDPWLGSGSAQVMPRDIRRALYLLGVAGLLNLCWIAALAVIRVG